MTSVQAVLFAIGAGGLTAGLACGLSPSSSPPPIADCDAAGVHCAPLDAAGTDDGGGSSSGSSGAGSSSSGGASSSGGTDGGGEGGATDSGEAGAEGGCPAGLTLTVHNFDNWCTVSLNGAATNVSASYESCAGVGSGASIVVGPASSAFELGPNPFVSISGAEVPDAGTRITGDGGFGSTRTVDVGNSGVSSTGICVLLCCPFADGTGCDSSQSGYTTFLSDCPQ